MRRGTGYKRGTVERKGQEMKGRERGGRRKKREKKGEGWRKNKGRPLSEKQTRR